MSAVDSPKSNLPVAASLTASAGPVSRDLQNLLESMGGEKRPYRSLESSPTVLAFGERAKSAAPWLQKTGAGHQLRAPIHSWERVGADAEKLRSTKALSEQLFDSLATFKVLTSHISMHIGRDRRDELFKWMDDLFVERDWDPEDKPTKISCFRTFLRLLLLTKTRTLPGISATADGLIVAAWYIKDDRLSVVCEPDDRVRFALTARTDDQIERATGETKLPRLLEALSPYSPGRWFEFAKEAAD